MSLLHHIVEHDDIARGDRMERPIMRFEFVAEPSMLDRIAALGSKEADLDDDELKGDAEEYRQAVPWRCTEEPARRLIVIHLKSYGTKIGLRVPEKDYASLEIRANGMEFKRAVH